MGTKKRQLEIVGADLNSIEAIDEIAGPYTTALYERQELQTKESALRQQLAERMAQLDLDEYVYHDGEHRYRLTQEHATKIKCKRVKEDGEVEPGDE